MRTPGEDEELAAGFLAGEGLIAGPGRHRVASARPPTWPRTSSRSRTRAGLRRDPSGRALLPPDLVLRRLRQGRARARPHRRARRRAPEPQPLPPAAVAAAPAAIRAEQDAFDRTGGLHATGLFGADGDLRVVREDVGRHNAMDKAIGSELLAGSLAARTTLFACVSGRASFELVQKAGSGGPRRASSRWARRRRSRCRSRASAAWCSAASSATVASMSTPAPEGVSSARGGVMLQQPVIDELLERAAEVGCLEFSAIGDALEGGRLDDESVEQVYAEAQRRGIRLADDCGREAAGHLLAGGDRRRHERLAPALPARHRAAAAPDRAPRRSTLAKRIERGDQEREAADDRVEPAARRLQRQALPRPRACRSST